MHRLGHEPTRLEMALAVAGEWLGRLKLNGRLRGYSPVSRLEEFEMLSAGILTKASLWRTLRIVLDGEDRAAGTDFDRLVERAESQLLMLEEHREQIAHEVFPADVGPPPTVEPTMSAPWPRNIGRAEMITRSTTW